MSLYVWFNREGLIVNFGIGFMNSRWSTSGILVQNLMLSISSVVVNFHSTWSPVRELILSIAFIHQSSLTHGNVSIRVEKNQIHIANLQMTV